MNISKRQLLSAVITVIMIAALLTGCEKSKQNPVTTSGISATTATGTEITQTTAVGESITATSVKSGVSGTVTTTTKAAATAVVTTKPNTTVAAVKVGYSLNDVKKLTNFTYATEITKNGKNETPYRVFRTANRIKVEWLYDKTKDTDENNDSVLGTVQYVTAVTFVDNKQYKQLKFYNEPSKPGADIGYRGKDIVSAYHLWEQHDVTTLLNGSGITKIGTEKAEGLDVPVYAITKDGKTHKIYYNSTYKTWLKYEILIGNTVTESYLAKGFRVGGVTETQADWPTKLPGHPELPGYALINISAMAGLKD